MAPKVVYGKRAHVYSNFAGFASPAKTKRQVEVVHVAEIEDDLERLALQTDPAESPKKNASPKARKALAERNENAVLKPPRRSRQANPGQPEKQPVVVEERRTSIMQKLNQLPTRSESEVAEYSSVDPALKDVVEHDLQRPQEPFPTNVSTQPALKAISVAKATAPSEPTIYESHASSLLSLSSHNLKSFTTWSQDLSSHFSITKIAEASFGEVYRLALLRPHAKLRRGDESVLKIIALKPPQKKGKLSKTAKKKIEMMSSPEDVAGEVRLMQRMTTVPGYTNFREICVLQGRPGEAFTSAWNRWNEVQKSKGKEVSVFPDPAKRSSYPEEQLWAVIEMQDAGTDLEKQKLTDIWSIWDVFWGVVLALGKGETEVRFEHRDLHMGNICVTRQAEESASDGKHMDLSKKLGFTGIETTIIDYTISRAELGARPMTKDEVKGEDVAFVDLEKDLTLFEGDAEQEYQYDMYRYMRAAMFLDEPLADLYERWNDAEDSGRTWRGFHPQTNLVWLHFVLHELLRQMEVQPRLSTGDAEEGEEKAALLHDTLSSVAQLLEPSRLPTSGLRSACDIIALALRESWLDQADVQGRRHSTVPSKRTRARAGPRRGRCP